MIPPHDRAARFADWMREYRGIVVKVARSYTSTAADEADLRQDLMLQIWISLSAYAGQAGPSTWIYRVCLNTALTWRRGAARREARIETGADTASLASETASPAEHAGDRDLLDKLYAAIHAMPPSERALVLLALDGLAYRDIAEITGMTENHVGVVLTRARQRLAARMKGVADELE